MADLAERRLPTGRTGQLIALLLLLLLTALAWSAVGAPMLAWHTERADALDRRATLARRMAEVAADLPRLEQQAAAGTNAAQAPASPNQAPVALIEGGSDAVASAALQQRLQELAARAGLDLASTESLPTQQLGTYRLIGLRVTASAPWPSIVRFLQAVEQASPPMLADDLQVHGAYGFIRDGAAPLQASVAIKAFRAGTTAQ